MRFIFMDEAGTSQHEPMTIVVGLIVNADTQLVDAEAAIKEINEGVPAELRDGFVFHAKDILNNNSYQKCWTLTDRLELIKRMLAIPRRHRIPIAFAKVKRTEGEGKDQSGLIVPGYIADHAEAFAICVAQADKFIRDQGEVREVGTVIAEEVHGMRRRLVDAVNFYRNNPIVRPPGQMVPTEKDKEQGYISQESEMRVTRIRESMLFVDKTTDVMTQLADAVAFGIRRYASEEKFGDQFSEALFGKGNEMPKLEDLKISRVSYYIGVPGK